MITLHGRSASTVSSVLPKIDEPVRGGGSAITTAAAWISFASSTIRRPASPARTFSKWPLTRRRPRRRAASIAACALASASGMTASIGAAEDLQEGFFDRLRSLPVPRIAIVAGRVVADTVLAAIGLTVTTIVGFAMGFRTSAPLGNLLLAVALCLFAAFAFTWMFVLLGILAGNPQAAQGLGLIVFPFTFVSSAFVPVESMPGWMQAFARNQPLTDIVNATRAFTLGDDAQRVLGHSASYFATRSLFWCLLFIAVFAPLAARRYQHG